MVKSPSFVWVSPYSADDSKGGWKAMQFHLLRALEGAMGPAHRITSVDVPEEFASKWLSRIQKKISIPRRYAYYSEFRLKSFANLVQSQLPEKNDLPIIFFGALPFVKCKPTAPYYIYTDGAFFIHYWEYNQDHSHSKEDIKRICSTEAEFMGRSAGVWCSSQRVADRITQEFGLEAGKAVFVGTGPGDVPKPLSPLRYENFLVMVSGDFERKGGRLAVEAVEVARKLGAQVHLKFIGATPPPDVLARPFVEWCGWFDMTNDVDRMKFAEVLSRAGAQILLSRTDLTPLVIPEVASYEKATFATAVGGIPEMIRDAETGWLFSPDASAKDIGETIAEIFKDPARLAKTGTAAKNFCRENWSWEAVGRITTAEFIKVNA